MKLLLDTHIFLWWVTDDPQLSTKARELIGDGHNTLYWSAASSWEVSIKYALGRMPLPEPPEQFLPVEIEKNRLESLPIIDAHAFQTGQVAQAQVESISLLSNDRQLNHYDVEIHW
jgi:PIN domain nuclease of toxin-antitoxin system